MSSSMQHWALLGWLAASSTAVNAAHSLSPAQIVPRDDLVSSIDTAGDEDMEAWLAALQRAPAFTICPPTCRELEASGQGWAVYPDQASLGACNETMLVDVVFQNEIDNGQNADLALQACVADFSARDVAFRPKDDVAALCTTPNHVMIDRPVALSSYVAGADLQESFSTQHLLAAGRQVLYQLSSETPSCAHNAMSMAYFQSSLIGVFGGAEIHQHGLTAEVLERFLAHAEKTSLSKTTLVQLCESDGRGADYGMGIIAGSTQSFAVVQKAMRSWESGHCVADAAGGDDGDNNDWMTVTIRVPKAEPYKTNSTRIVLADDVTSPARLALRDSFSHLDRRANCGTTKVKAGDGCWAVAERCKITQDKLKKYNPRKNFCDTLAVGETVCCSSGTLPSTIPAGNSDGTCKIRRVIKDDTCTTLASKCGLSGNDFMKVNTKTNLCGTLIVGQPVCCSKGKLPFNPPKQKSNGYCADYVVKKGDECAKIAVMNDITVKDLMVFNKQTWGWIGCDPLYTGRICLSKGSPPMPASVSNAVCGPTVPGTSQPAAGKNISSLNPCPLNACCNNWGNCGLTSDFCKINKAASGNPGTAAPGKSGCIDNCGMGIVKGAAPAKKINVAYFEAWNHKRKCLKMDVDMIDTKRYNTIHFAFIDITKDFKMDTSKVQDQFDRFKDMSGVHKVVSFGGWEFSNSPGTFHILREATKAANRATFVKNLVDFVKKHSLDGIDLDWEYPGAPDIPDIPPGNPEEGDNYYQTLLSLKKQIGTGKTVSFAAPASFHYLKSFPMKKMGEALDYIIYMTYDLHGQWDYGNKWTSPGCPSGNCLRSHVNETETKDALAMITKAGVPSGKIVVGVASYGRSFKMAKAGCDGANCLFTGTNRVSNAKKGRCTDTAGYISNAELGEILKSNRVTRKWKAEGSNMLVYDQTEWVAYMDEDTKKARSSFYSSYNFAGTTDWAVDLQEFNEDVSDSNGKNNDDHPTIRNRFSKCTKVFTSFDQLNKVADDIPDHCMNRYIFGLEIRIMESALKNYKALVDDGYDKKFKTYAGYVEDQVPPQINKFISEQGNDYFKCKEYTKLKCCNDCTFATCWEDCVRGNDCKSGPGFRGITCPSKLLDSNEPGTGPPVPNTTWIMQDEDKFFKDIYKKYGIEESWIKFDTVRINTPQGCQFAGEDVLDCIDKHANKFFNFPVKDKVKVFDPKDIIGDGYPESKDLLRRLKIRQANMDMDFSLTALDLVDSASLPAFAMEEAVKNMDKIVEKAKEIKEAERNEFILNFISGLLFFIPFVGSAVGSVGMTSLRSMLSLIGAAGEAGLLVYGIVDDPDSALMAIFGFLAGGGIGRGGFRNAAQARRGMSSKEMASLGPIKANLDTISSLQGSRCSI